MVLILLVVIIILSLLALYIFGRLEEEIEKKYESQRNLSAFKRRLIYAENNRDKLKKFIESLGFIVNYSVFGLEVLKKTELEKASKIKKDAKISKKACKKNVNIVKTSKNIKNEKEKNGKTKTKRQGR